MFNFKLAASWLAESVASKTPALILADAQAFELKAQPYVNMGGSDATIPSFDTGYHFTFHVDDAEVVILEILTKDEGVFQAGYQIIFPKRLFKSVAKNVHSEVTAVLAGHFGGGQRVKHGAIVGSTYQDATRTAYITLARSSGKEVLTMRICNRKFWG